MSHEEIFGDVRKEVESGKLDKIEDKPKNPLVPIMIALFILLIFIVSVVPYFYVKADPTPKNVPALGELITDSNIVNNTFKVSSSIDFLKLLNPDDPFIKQIAVKIATQSCNDAQERAKLCQAKAIYLFVRDNIQYVNDPVFPADDYVETAPEVLYTGGSDCDGMAVLLANLEGAIGVPVKFVFIPNHVYIWIYIEDAPGKYFIDKKDNFGWIRLDATCKDCGFGEIPTENIKKETLIV